jgi:hypothetical protein
MNGMGSAGRLYEPGKIHRSDRMAAAGLYEDGKKGIHRVTDPEPREYWRRQCFAIYQSDPIGIKLLAELGEDNIMWGSDFPHPDGVWPDSQQYIARELGHLSAATRKKIPCDNAARLYRFVD